MVITAPVTRTASLVTTARGQLPYADFFRAIAIFYVFIGHVGGLANEPHLFHHVALSEAVTLFDGVAMLFCLSGFLLSAPLLRAYLDTPSNLPLVRPYLLARFLRIYPLYATAVLAIGAYLSLTGRAPGWRDVAVHLAMLQNFSPHTIQSLSGPLWTMPLDIQFYLVLPLLFAIGARLLANRDLRTRKTALAVSLGAVIALSIAYRFVVVYRFAPAGLDDQLFIVDQFPGMACLFAIGIAARFVTMLIDREEIPVRSTSNTVIALILAAVAFRGVQYGAHGEWLHLAAGHSHFKPAIFAAVDAALAGLGCACLLIAANYAREGWFGRFIASPAVAFAAAISYGFYLFHFTIITDVRERLHGHSLLTLAALGIIGLAILIPLCTITHFSVEKYFLDRKARLKRVREPGQNSLAANDASAV